MGSIRERAGADRWPLLLLYAVWLAVVVWTAWHHVFFRDEVRALMFATSGATVVDMLRVLHGDGHPALWYLLLRGGDALIGKLALPVIAMLVAAAAAALLLWRAPFGWPLKALILASKFMLFEYVVMARNYGISMLLMFGFAALYPRWRTRGVGLGVVLLLLANTNVHSALLAGALMLFWIIDLTAERGWRWDTSLRLLTANAALLALGVALCFATVWPPFNDSATRLAHPGAVEILATLMLPGDTFLMLTPTADLIDGVSELWVAIILTVLMLTTLLSFARRPALMAAGMTSLFGLALFFTILYPGFYRHEALWIVLVITLYWLAAEQPLPDPVARGDRRRMAIGVGAFALLLALQVWTGIEAVAADLGAPQSDARALGRLIARTPELHNAIIIAEPDNVIGTLPYYLDNPIEQVRLSSPGTIFAFTHKAKLSISLDDLLSKARQLHGDRHAPVIILNANPVDPRLPAQSTPESYEWIYTSTPESSRRFLAATRRLHALGQVSGVHGEGYDAYLLDN